MKILLAEDEERVSSFIKRGLEESGHHVTQAFDGNAAIEEATAHSFDVIILDVIMPHMNGIDVCMSLRNEYQIQTPILMLTALGATDDVVTGLKSGADDYLVKPFKFKELLARLEAMNRRSQQASGLKEEVLKVKDLSMNLPLKEVHRSGSKIELTAREFKLLEFLLRNKNRVVSRPEILEHVWGIDFDLGTNVIDVYINYLRNKIDKNYENKLIKTVIGTGYIIKE